MLPSMRLSGPRDGAAVGDDSADLMVRGSEPAAVTVNPVETMVIIRSTAKSRDRLRRTVVMFLFLL